MLTEYLVATLPPGPERDEVISLMQIGQRFKAQQCGKRPGYLAQTLLAVARTVAPPVTFEKVLDELELAAARRSLYGESTSPIEKVDRVWELLTYHDPRQGRRQVTFKRLRNLVSGCKKTLRAPIPAMP